METDFISRKDAKDKHCEICEHFNICYQYDDDCCRTYTGRTCIERQYFNAIPAAEVRPVVHGKWIDYNPEDWYDPRMKCSVCGAVALPLPTDVFCSKCGADLRPERSNNEL